MRLSEIDDLYRRIAKYRQGDEIEMCTDVHTLVLVFPFLLAVTKAAENLKNSSATSDFYSLYGATGLAKALEEVYRVPT